VCFNRAVQYLYTSPGHFPQKDKKCNRQERFGGEEPTY